MGLWQVAKRIDPLSNYIREQNTNCSFTCYLRWMYNMSRKNMELKCFSSIDITLHSRTNCGHLFVDYLNFEHDNAANSMKPSTYGPQSASRRLVMLFNPF